MISKLQLQSILGEPAWLLSGIDADTKQLIFVETTESQIRRLPFLDGREPVSNTGREVSVPLKQLIDRSSAPCDVLSGGVVLHTSFCGSTLLSQLIQASTNVLVYREPQILVQLADLKAAGHPISTDKSLWNGLLSLVGQQLQKSWMNVPTVIKPSNWANTLLNDFDIINPAGRFVVLTIPEDDFLLANLRGGKSRLNFSLSLLNHYLKAGLASRQDVLEVERGGHSPMGRLLRLLVVLHRAQASLLDNYVPDSPKFTLNQIQLTPESVLEQTGWTFGLKLDPTLTSRAIQSVMPLHAKSGGDVYDGDTERAEMNRLRAEFSDEFDALANWRDNEKEQIA